MKTRSLALIALTLSVGCKDPSAPNAQGTRTCSAEQVPGAKLEGEWRGERDTSGRDLGELTLNLKDGKWSRTSLPSGAKTEGIYSVTSEGVLDARANGSTSAGAYPVKAWIGNGGDCMFFDNSIVWRKK
jgi:hypothetical protein